MTIATSLNVTALGNISTSKSTSKSVTITAQHVSDPQSVTNTWEALEVGDVSVTRPMAYIENLDAALILQVALANDNSGIFLSLGPGEGNFVSLHTGTVFVRCSTSATILMNAIVVAR